MAKLRKMLGDINSQECRGLMAALETQSKATIADWSISYAKQKCLPVLGGMEPFASGVSACERHLSGEIPLKEIKPVLKEMREAAAKIDEPIAQAAARAVATACAAITTPTNGLGFLFYAAAVRAYTEAGLNVAQDVYDELAQKELGEALASLQSVLAENEPNPAKINWNC